MGMLIIFSIKLTRVSIYISSFPILRVKDRYVIFVICILKWTHIFRYVSEKISILAILIFMIMLKDPSIKRYLHRFLMRIVPAIKVMDMMEQRTKHVLIIILKHYVVHGHATIQRVRKGNIEYEK